MANDADQGKNSVDDISLDEPKMPKKASSGPVAVLVIIIVVVAVALFGYTSYLKNEQAKAAAKAKADAAQARTAQLAQAKANLEEAIQQAAQGNVATALAKLQVAENQYGLIISAANAAGDQDAANSALTDKQVIVDARKAIEAEQANFQAAVNAQLDTLRSKFGLAAPAPAATEGAAPTTEGAAPAADATAPTATGTEAQPTAPTTTDTTAPAPSAPAAPATAVPAAPAAPVAPAAPAAPAASPSSAAPAGG